MTAWFQKKDAETEASKEAAPKPSGRQANGVSFSQLLGDDTILIAPAGLDKTGLLETLVVRLCEARSLPDRQALLAKVLEREQGISTTLDTGLSLPHARVEGISQIVAALALVPHGIADPKQPGLTIRVMFLFFSPNKPEAFSLHLQLLRGVASLFQSSLIERLSHAPSPAEALALLRAQETQGSPS